MAWAVFLILLKGKKGVAKNRQTLLDKLDWHQTTKQENTAAACCIDAPSGFLANVWTYSRERVEKVLLAPV